MSCVLAEFAFGVGEIFLYWNDWDFHRLGTDVCDSLMIKSRRVEGRGMGFGSEWKGQWGSSSAFAPVEFKLRT